MTCLSIVREDGRPEMAADPIFLLEAMTAKAGQEIAFEVFDADAGELKNLVGERRCFYMDEVNGAFWAQLKSLEPCTSTCILDSRF